MAELDAFELIRKKEGFQPAAYWDRNHWRVGYGSDTWTDDNGITRTVTQATTVTKPQAEANLQLRVPQFQQSGILNYVDKEAWDRLPSPTKAAITSLAYNYGSLSGLKSLRNAINSGDTNAIADAVAARGVDNGGINKKRRDDEASIIRGHPLPPGEVPNAVGTEIDLNQVATPKSTIGARTTKALDGLFLRPATPSTMLQETRNMPKPDPVIELPRVDPRGKSAQTAQEAGPQLTPEDNGELNRLVRTPEGRVIDPRNGFLMSMDDPLNPDNPNRSKSATTKVPGRLVERGAERLLDVGTSIIDRGAKRATNVSQSQIERGTNRTPPKSVGQSIIERGGSPIAAMLGEALVINAVVPTEQQKADVYRTQLQAEEAKKESPKRTLLPTLELTPTAKPSAAITKSISDAVRGTPVPPANRTSGNPANTTGTPPAKATTRTAAPLAGQVALPAGVRPLIPSTVEKLPEQLPGGSASTKPAPKPIPTSQIERNTTPKIEAKKPSGIADSVTAMLDAMPATIPIVAPKGTLPPIAPSTLPSTPAPNAVVTTAPVASAPVKSNKKVAGITSTPTTTVKDPLAASRASGKAATPNGVMKPNEANGLMNLIGSAVGLPLGDLLGLGVKDKGGNSVDDAINAVGKEWQKLGGIDSRGGTVSSTVQRTPQGQRGSSYVNESDRPENAIRGSSLSTYGGGGSGGNKSLLD